MSGARAQCPLKTQHRSGCHICVEAEGRRKRADQEGREGIFLSPDLRLDRASCDPNFGLINQRLAPLSVATEGLSWLEIVMRGGL